MPNDLTPELLARTLSQVLEEAAFVFAEPTDAPPELEPEVIEARLAFSGPGEGELILAASEGFAATLAANLLGEDEGGAAVVGDDQDAVGELLNMIAGALVVAIFGSDVPCRLGLPRVRIVPADEHAEALASTDIYTILVEEEGRRIDLSARMGSAGAEP